jgi:hypothetical protein
MKLAHGCRLQSSTSSKLHPERTSISTHCSTHTHTQTNTHQCAQADLQSAPATAQIRGVGNKPSARAVAHSTCPRFRCHSNRAKQRQSARCCRISCVSIPSLSELSCKRCLFVASPSVATKLEEPLSNPDFLSGNSQPQRDIARELVHIQSDTN